MKRWALALGVVLVGVPARASADPPDSRANTSPSTQEHPPVIVPPRALGDVRAAYPKGAEGRATVVVELTVTAEGDAQDVHAASGDEPWATPALEAVRALRFDPATRDGHPIAAKIRMRVDFEPPVERPVELPPDPYEDPLPTLPKNPYDDLAPSPPAPKVEQVEVAGTRRVPRKISLGRAEVRDMPGAFGDAFRAIDSLPGVTPMASGLPFFFVRGAPPGSTGYFLDGIRLPVLFHLGAGPSIVHPGLIDHVDFYPAAAPAIYGRASGGIVAAETRRPEGHARGEANLRLLDAGALVESPLPKGMGSALAAGRFGYPGLLLPLFAPNTRLSYWDYQLRGTLNLSEHDTLTVFALGSYDYLGRRTRQRPSGTGSPTVDDPVGFGETERRDLETRTIFETDVSRIEAKHEHREAGTLVREAFVLGRDTTALGLRDRVETDLLSGRVDVERRLSDAIAVTGGLDVAYQRYAVRAEGSPIPSPEFEALFPARDELVLGGRIDATYTLRDRMRITAGLRVDRYSAYRIEDVGYALSPDPLPGTRLSVEPRLSARVAVVPRVTFVSTAGIAGQPPRFALPLPGLTIGRLGEGLERAVQASEGLEWALPFALTVTTTVFASRTVGLADFFAACPGGRGAFTDGNACSGRSGGSAFGFELYVKRAFGEKLTGFLSYTLSRSTRTIPITVFGSALGPSLRAELEPEDGKVTVASDYDRTHVLSTALAYAFGNGYRAGAKLVVYSGRPYTPKRFDGTFLGTPNGSRLPLFHRIDLRLEKSWSFSQGRRISAVLEGLNVTLRPEANDVTCGVRAGEDDIDLGDGCVAEEIGPIAVPSIGVEAVF